MGLLLDWGLFGIDMNVWLDAFLRLQLVVIVMTVTVMGLIYLERKFVGRIQMRLGPMRTGPYGTLQSIADAVKLLTKEDLRPATADFWLFELAPYATFVPVFMTLMALPFMEGWFVRDLQLGIFYIVAISGVTVIGYLMAGWASDNKYALLGAVRSAAQLISYELPLILAVLAVSMVAGSLNLTEIVRAQDTGLGLLGWYWLPLFPMFVIFFISALAETNRPPFDLVEAESELVAGHMIEYSSTPFLLFFLGEYVAIVLMCALTTILFLGGWLPPLDIAPFNWIPGVIWFVLKVCLVFFMFAMVKAFVPRYRYDQLMRLGWKVFLPISLAMVVITAAVLKVWELSAA